MKRGRERKKLNDSEKERMRERMEERERERKGVRVRVKVSRGGKKEKTRKIIVLASSSMNALLVWSCSHIVSV